MGSYFDGISRQFHCPTHNFQGNLWRNLSKTYLKTRNILLRACCIDFLEYIQRCWLNPRKWCEACCGRLCARRQEFFLPMCLYWSTRYIIWCNWSAFLPVLLHWRCSWLHLWWWNLNVPGDRKSNSLSPYIYVYNFSWNTEEANFAYV